MRPSARLVVLAVLGLASSFSAAGQEAGAPPKKRLFAVGGWGSPKDALPLLRFFIGLTGKQNPKVCLLPTASGDAAESIVAWYDLLNQLDCRPRHLRLFHPSRVEDFEKVLLDMDAVFVGGGNTLNMLAVWRDQGIDQVLRKAWTKGIVLGGSSAGAICWFRRGCSDSRPGRLTAVDGLGWLPGSACPHFNHEKRRTAFQEMVLAGELPDALAFDDGVGVLFEDETRVRVVSSLPKAGAYAVRRRDGRVEATALETERLGR